MTVFWIFAVPIIALTVVIIARSSARDGLARDLKTAKSAYAIALLALQQAPSDPSVKQRALAAGRTYSNLTRNRKGVTIFDEMALSNDIAAASAASSAAPAVAVAVPAPRGTTAERLAALGALRTQGLVTESEYAARRQQILDGI